MDIRQISEKQIARDTVKMTLLSLAMQTASMLFNVKLSGDAGTAAVGLMSLTFTLFSFIMVLANGNILTSTSRFVSEARGAGHRNFCKIMRYSLTFSQVLSMGFAAISFLLSDMLSIRLTGSSEIGSAVRLIALSLPFASAGSCIKGYFHGIRRVNVPMKGDVAEFTAKWLTLFGGLILFGGTERFYIVTAAGILAGEVISFLYYLAEYLKEYRLFRGQDIMNVPLLTDTPADYLKNTFPILLSGYVQMLMSTANELLVPAALLRFSKSTDEALAGYGMFEALIIPAVFFPSAVLTSLSGVIIPEAALANREAGDVRRSRLRRLTHGILEKAFSYSFFVAAMFFYGGRLLGTLLCPSDSLVGDSLVILAPVIPFIYLEIVLEGLLKGMGRQNFSTVNSLCEYAVRIACVIIFVGKIGFMGVIISYYASNVLSNISRMIVVCRESGLKFDPICYVVTPLLKGLICCEAGRAAVLLAHAEYSGNAATLILFVLTACAVFAVIFPLKKSRSSALTEKSSV